MLRSDQFNARGQFLSKTAKALSRWLSAEKKNTGTICRFTPETSDTYFQPCHSWEWLNSRKIISESDEQQGACNESKGWGLEKSPEGPHEGTPAEEDEESPIFTEKDSVWQIGPEQTHAEPEIPTYCSRRSINTVWSMVSRQRGPTEEELKSQAFCENITSVWVYCGGWTVHAIPFFVIQDGTVKTVCQELWIYLRDRSVVIKINQGLNYEGFLWRLWRIVLLLFNC